MGSLWIKKFRGYEDFPLPEPAGTTYKDVYKNINEDLHFKKNILKNIKKESIVSISSWPWKNKVWKYQTNFLRQFAGHQRPWE